MLKYAYQIGIAFAAQEAGLVKCATGLTGQEEKEVLKNYGLGARLARAGTIVGGMGAGAGLGALTGKAIHEILGGRGDDDPYWIPGMLAGSVLGAIPGVMYGRHQVNTRLEPARAALVDAALHRAGKKVNPATRKLMRKRLETAGDISKGRLGLLWGQE